MSISKSNSVKCLLVLVSSFFVTCAWAKSSTSLEKELANLEASSGGRIGIYAINTANGENVQYRAKERFPMGCTSKVMGVATILNKSMKDGSLLSQTVRFNKSDLAEWSPITEKYYSTGMTVEQLCAASISYSDNTAMNLLVNKMGGLDQMNEFARSIHNKSFRQDHAWPEEAASGGKKNVYDSATPKAMAESLQELTFSNTLADPQRTLLLTWLKANTTGGNRIKAGVPKEWVVADKTGTGSAYGTTNDLGIIWPPKCAPIIMGVYYTSNDKNAAKREDVVASVTRLLIAQFAQTDSCIHKNIS
jgi:beta-lactamase class A